MWLTLFFIAGIALALSYSFLLRGLLSAWYALPEWEIQEGWMPRTRVTVIVPARNEEKHIQACLHHILHQDYPKTLLEVIVVDDHSTDRTAAITEGFTASNLRLLPLAGHLNADSSIQSYKKKAIE